MSGKPAGMIALPSEMCLEEGADMQALSDWVFPDLAIRILLGISMFRTMAEQVVLWHSTAVLTRRLGPPAGTRASGGRGSIPRGGPAAAPPL